MDSNQVPDGSKSEAGGEPSTSRKQEEPSQLSKRALAISMNKMFHHMTKVVRRVNRLSSSLKKIEARVESVESSIQDFGERLKRVEDFSSDEEEQDMDYDSDSTGSSNSDCESHKFETLLKLPGGDSVFCKMEKQVSLMMSRKLQELVIVEDLPRTNRDVLFTMGGFGKPKSVETWDSAVGCWVSHNIPEAPSEWTWIGSVGHKILVLERTNHRFRSFDVCTREWTQLQYLPEHRMSYTATGSEDNVFVLGGHDHYGTRCDKYDVHTDQWEEIVSMPESREFAASVCHGGKVYCAGGLSVPGGALSSVVVLDTQGKEEWSHLPDMGVERYNHCLISCGRFLWAIGGRQDITYLSSVERFDWETSKWSHIQPLSAPRDCFSASFYDGKIYVTGGDIVDYICVWIVEVYDEETGRWTPTSMQNEGKRLHGSCVVRSLSADDAKQYAVAHRSPRIPKRRQATPTLSRED